MQFDDRLATVLRHRAANAVARRTQYRQLIDLLGAQPAGGDTRLLAAGWLRLGALGEHIPAAERAAMLREPGLRLRSAQLIAHLANDDAPEVAAAALAAAQLPDDDWAELIPRLPVRARGFLRLRRDISGPTQALLERLGIHDRALPMPDEVTPDDAGPAQPSFAVPPPAVPLRPALKPTRHKAAAPPAPANDPALAEGDSIGALVRRIEAFQRNRAAQPAQRALAASPRLPLGEERAGEGDPIVAFSFSTDGEGRIDWADPSVAPMVIGKRLAAMVGPAFQRRQPLRALALPLSGAPAIAGDWIVDAAPRFTVPDGRYYGYIGRFRRPGRNVPAADRESDRIRQLLHELRTPVNAIQGFAEVIQQQLFAPTPHEYRAHAAAIASDAARILAGFDGLDRLTRLELGAAQVDAGEADLVATIKSALAHVGPAMTARSAAIHFAADPASAALVPIAPADLEALAWRLVATLANALAPGEEIALTVLQEGNRAILAGALPGSLARADDPFAAVEKTGGAVSAGLFGGGFALRLARAEARSAGGNLTLAGGQLRLILPGLTAQAPRHTAVARS